jgi:hypothetical protein
VFADSRKLAEEYTYRYLAAALVHHAPDREGPPTNRPDARREGRRRAASSNANASAESDTPEANQRPTRR